MFDLVVTRHPALVQHLTNLGLVNEETVIVAHVTPDLVRDKKVCGVLPHSLSCLTKTFTEVPLMVPAELRGVELTLEQVRQYAGKPVTYRIFTERDFSEAIYNVADAAAHEGCCAPVDWESYF